MLNIGIILFPPYLAKMLGDDKEVLLVTHRLGVCLALCCIPILFVSNTFKSEKLKRRERRRAEALENSEISILTVSSQASFNQDDYQPDELEHAKMTNFYKEVLCSKKFYIMSSQYAIAFIPVIMIQSVGPYYLKEIKYSEVESAVLISYTLGIGFCVALICNISDKIVIMNKICILTFGLGSIITGTSAILHKNSAYLQIQPRGDVTFSFLIIGLTLMGIGCIPNLSFAPLVLMRTFPRIDYSVLLVLPQIVGTGALGVFVNWVATEY